MLPGWSSMTWTKYLINSKLYGVGKECPKDWTLLSNTELVSAIEKCYFEKCIVYIKYTNLCPMTEDESLAFVIFLLTCYYVREHDSIEFEHIHKHIWPFYAIFVNGRIITLHTKGGHNERFRVKAILIEPYKGKEDDISIEYYPEKKRYHSHVSIADLGIKYSMSFDYIGQKTD